MKQFFLFFFLLFIINNSFAQSSKFSLDGNIKGIEDGTILLSYAGTNGKAVSDSCAIANGKFSFTGNIVEPTMCYLRLREPKYNEKNAVNFFIEPGKMTINITAGDFQSADIKGSKTQKENESLRAIYKKIDLKYKKQLDSLSAEKDHDKSAEIRERLEPFFAERNQADLDFFKKHPASYVTAFMLRFHVSDLSLDSLEGFYDNLGAKLQASQYGKTLNDEIQKLRGGSPGSMANDFSAIDINGKSVNLSDFKGKWVLLDFWASWCVPCRKGNPHLKQLYSKYKEKGIEFIGVSDDDHTPDAWRKAVEKDGLPWLHVLRGLDMEKIRNKEPNEKDISEKFGIHVLPTKILIDPQGKIVGRYNEEEKELDAKLAEIFKS